MRQLKLFRKVIAIIIAICMSMPFFFNQSLNAIAEENENKTLDMLESISVNAGKNYQLSDYELDTVSEGLDKTYTGKLFTVTLQEDQKISWSAPEAIVTLFNKENQGYAKDWTFQQDYLENSSTQKKTYYLFVEGKDITFNEIVALPQAENITTAQLDTLTVGEKKDIKDLISKRIQLNASVSGNPEETYKKQGRWLTFTVPAGKTYDLTAIYNSGLSDQELMSNYNRYAISYYVYTNVFSEDKTTLNQYDYSCSAIDCASKEGTSLKVFREGTYYIYMDDTYLNNAISIDFLLSDIETLNSNIAVEVEEKQVESGKLTISAKNTRYAYLTMGPDLEQYKTGYGGFIKVTVPAKKTYTFTFPQNCSGGYLYRGSDWTELMNIFTSEITIPNLSDKELISYIWVILPDASSTIDATIRVESSGYSLKDVVDEDKTLPFEDGTIKMDEEGVLSLQRPIGEDAYSPTPEKCKIYKVNIPAKSQVMLTGYTPFLVYIDVEKGQIVDGDYEINLVNFTDSSKAYYMWAFDHNLASGTEITRKTTPIKSLNDGTQTTISTSGADIVVSANNGKTSVQAEQKTNGTLKQALNESINITKQYNADNSGNKVNTIQTEITDASNTIVDKDTIAKLKNIYDDVTVDIDKKTNDGKVDYGWSFESSGIKQSEDTFEDGVNTNITVYREDSVKNYENDGIVESQTDKDSSNCVLKFDHDGMLPDNTSVKVLADQYTEGETLTYYHIDTQTQKLEKVGTTEVKDGYATLKLEHCSDYVLSGKKTESTPNPKPTPEPAPTPAPTPTPVVTPNVTVSYRTHVQSIGWQNPVTNGTMSGTSGKAKRLEGIEISVAGNSNLGIQYTTHCQSYGWLPWSANGEMNGTEGEAKRLEAIKIQLTGADKDKYNVYYRVHAQSYGWLAWAANGAPAGTAGLAKRLEAIQIVIVKKGESFDHAIGNIQSARGEAYIASSTANANPVVAGENNVNVEYRTHVQSFGWQGWKYNGVMSGTSGKAKRLEGINIKLTNKPYSGSIVYTTHVQSIGWQGNENNVNTWFRDGQMAGTSGRAKRLEAIRIALTGEMAEHYDVYYRVHAQSFGWLDWTKNGEAAGTAGLAKRLEGIQIVLVPKGGAAPARNYGGVVTINNNSYIKR